MNNNDSIEVTNNDFLRQFEATIEGELACIEYAEQERKIFLTKIKIADAARDNGKMEDFIKAVLEKIKSMNTRVMPTSPEIAKFMRKNRRKYKDLLPVGINI